MGPSLRENRGFPGPPPAFKISEQARDAGYHHPGRCEALEIFGPIGPGGLKDASGTKGPDLYACLRRVWWASEPLDAPE
jgi:hypothetical protein